MPQTTWVRQSFEENRRAPVGTQFQMKIATLQLLFVPNKRFLLYAPASRSDRFPLLFAGHRAQHDASQERSSRLLVVGEILRGADPPSRPHRHRILPSRTPSAVAIHLVHRLERQRSRWWCQQRAWQTSACHRTPKCTHHSDSSSLAFVVSNCHQGQAKKLQRAQVNSVEILAPYMRNSSSALSKASCFQRLARRNKKKYTRNR